MRLGSGRPVTGRLSKGMRSVGPWRRDARMPTAQRGVRKEDLHLAFRIKIEVQSGIFMLVRDCDEFVHRRKWQIERVVRLKDQGVAIQGDRIITTSDTTPGEAACVAAKLRRRWCSGDGEGR